MSNSDSQKPFIDRVYTQRDWLKSNIFEREKFDVDGCLLFTLRLFCNQTVPIGKADTFCQPLKFTNAQYRVCRYSSIIIYHYIETDCWHTTSVRWSSVTVLLFSCLLISFLHHQTTRHVFTKLLFPVRKSCLNANDSINFKLFDTSVICQLDSYSPSTLQTTMLR